MTQALLPHAYGFGEPCMPGVPGPRQPGGDTDASDAIRQRAADTPYGDAACLPITHSGVGAPAYLHNNTNPPTGGSHE